MTRSDSLKQLATATIPFDVLVIGGGATGLGTALDAATRGHRTVLVEQSDFGKATSSRSTKLAHGGVRYLQQGNIKLVLEALKERGRMLRNAPHLSRRQSFVIPAYHSWQVPFFGVGLTMYDLLSGRASIGRSRMLGKETVKAMLPTVVGEHLAGGIEYFDGQFDDARFCLALAQTLEDHGGTALNYTRVTALLKINGKVSGASVRDEETGESFDIQARIVINATGIFTDDVRRLDEPQAPPILTVSQGSHIVLDKSWLPGTNALMVPKTEDGRVLFAIPWHGATVVGTTDREVPVAQLEPTPLQAELDFIRHHVALYFGRKPAANEVLSCWSGLRPLVKQQGAGSTAAISREHTVLVSPSKLVSVTGGKWTTYRRMAEDTLNTAETTAGFSAAPCRTHELRLHGWNEASVAQQAEDTSQLPIYGSDQAALDALAASDPTLTAPLHPALPYRMAEVVWAVRHEMARTLDDVLARRTRCLFLNARATLEAAPAVAALMARELGLTGAPAEVWQQQQLATFQSIAANYVFKASPTSSNVE